jgi:hypothetical protein
MKRAGFDLRDQFEISEVAGLEEALAGKVNADAYSLLQPGEIGFGVAPAQPEKYAAIGATPYDGHDQVGSPNRGKYLHVASGAVLYHIPKHYFKEVGNTTYFSDTPQTGYVLDRSFINGGVEIDGVFIFAYGGGNNGGKLTAQSGLDPVSTNAAHNPISALSTVPANNYGGIYKAAKSCDANAFPTPIWQRAMVARLAVAHGKASTSTAVCAYSDVAPYQPKGNNNNALADTNDASVTFTGSGYSNCALTGSGVPFAKTTHNGQACGIADLNGNMYEAVSGLTYMARTGATGTLGSNAVALTAHGYIVGDKIAFGATPTTGATYNTAVYTVATVVDANNFTLTTTLERNVLSTDGIYTGKTFYMLKESVDIRALADDSTTPGTGAFNMSLYDAVDLSALINSNSAWIKLGNGTNDVFEFSTDRNSGEYKRNALGIPTVAGSSAGGTTEYGNDGIYRYLRHGCVPISGGHWGDTSDAGVGCVTLSNRRTRSHDIVGLRASLLA